MRVVWCASLFYHLTWIGRLAQKIEEGEIAKLLTLQRRGSVQDPEPCANENSNCSRVLWQSARDFRLYARKHHLQPPLKISRHWWFQTEEGGSGRHAEPNVTYYRSWVTFCGLFKVELCRKWMFPLIGAPRTRTWSFTGLSYELDFKRSRAGGAATEENFSSFWTD